MQPSAEVKEKWQEAPWLQMFYPFGAKVVFVQYQG